MPKGVTQQWIGFSNTTPIALTTTPVNTELIPDGMIGGASANASVKRIVGTIALQPQSAATAVDLVGLGIVRCRSAVGGAILGAVTSFDPLSTDVDSHAQDWLMRKMVHPSFGGPLDATALDLTHTESIDLKGRPTLRKMEKVHSLQLIYNCLTASRVQIQINLRILVWIW